MKRTQVGEQAALPMGPLATERLDSTSRCCLTQDLKNLNLVSTKYGFSLSRSSGKNNTAIKTEKSQLFERSQIPPLTFCNFMTPQVLAHKLNFSSCCTYVGQHFDRDHDSEASTYSLKVQNKVLAFFYFMRHCL